MIFHLLTFKLIKICENWSKMNKILEKKPKDYQKSNWSISLNGWEVGVEGFIV